MADNKIELAKAYVQIIPSAEGIQESLNSAMTSAGTKAGKAGGKGIAAGIGSVAGGIAKVAAAGIATATTGMIAFGKSAVTAGSSFDESMSQVAATMGKTMKDMEDETGSVDTAFGHFSGNLREFAQFMGKNTAFSATEAANALNYMALAGYDAQTSISMLPNVLSLAAAGGFDLARASDMVTDTQTAFGLSIERTSQMVDEMAKAASTGNTSVEQLGDAFLVVGGLAKELNGGMVTLADGTETEVDGVQELEIALTAMANAGIKGSEAGTHMRNMLLKLASPTSDGTAALNKMGVAVFDVEGNMRSLSAVFTDLGNAMGKMTQQEKLQVISDLFNTRDTASAEALLAAVGEDWDKIGAAILDAQGSAAVMAETQLDNLAGDTTKFKSALEGLQISVSDSLTPTLREFVQFGTDGMSKLTDAFNTGDMKKVASVFGSLLKDGVKMISKNLPLFIEMGGEIFGGLIDGLLAALPDLMEALPSLIEKFTEVFVKVSVAFTEALPQIITAIISALPTVLPMLISGLSSVIVSLLSNMGEIIGPLIENLPVIIDSVLSAVMDNLPQIIQGIISLVGQIILKLPEILMSLAESIWGTLSKLWEEWVGPALGKVGEFFGSIWEGICAFFDEVWAGIWEVWGPIWEWIDKNIVKPVSEALQKLWDWIKGIWDQVSGWFDEHVIQPVAGFFSNLWTGISEAVQSCITGIKDFFTPIVRWFDEHIIQPVAKFFSELWDGIKDDLKAFLNGVIGVLNKTIDGLNIILAPLRAVIMAVGNLFGANWTMDNVAIPHIPRLEAGGILEAGQIGLLEGNGAEAVVPLERNQKWISRVAEDLRTNMNDYAATPWEEVLDRLSHMAVVLDSGQTVGGLSTKMDQSIGKNTVLAGRGVAIA